MSQNFPGAQWESKSPDELGFSEEKLASVESWMLETAQGEPFRVVVARGGYIAAEWNHGIAAEEQLRQASASKSFYSCLLGIAEAEGKISCLDARVVECYPEMMDVEEGAGPKDGRHAFEKDRDITFRQLIGNTSGYMKPGEEPGKKFHYQTFGMNIVTNSLATAYGMYDSADPDRLPGC
ncbi:MAG: serine hydrolase, partial [Chloroflexi bacterium]|nr:serine hydrolase [Chloroflexota bacterium]